ncbi:MULTISPECIES: YncE family protein [Streptomyces]|uniref:YncE family protein n=1 Tax=Streptomyces TaxID=1883 RepID=UPI0034229D74
MSTNVQARREGPPWAARLAGGPRATATGGTVGAAPAMALLSVTSIPVPGGPVGVAVAPNGNAYVTRFTAAGVAVINTTTDTVIVPSIPVGTSPNSVSVAPNGLAYVADSGSNSVTVIDTATNSVVGATIPVGHNPIGVAVAPNGKIYVANFASGSVSVIQNPPTLSSISPTSGPTTGGTVVTLTGTLLPSSAHAGVIEP